MTKAEILEAINATIAPNGVKGITAESLANILTEIVNAAGEGGAGGEYLDMTPANPDDLESEELSEEAKAHNAEVYNKLLTALNAVAAIPMVSVNMVMGSCGYASSILSEEIEGATNVCIAFRLSLDDPTNYVVQGVNLSTSETTELTIGSDLMLVYLILHQDGSVTMSIPGLI